MIRPLADYDLEQFTHQLQSMGQNAAHAPIILRRFFANPNAFDPGALDCTRVLRDALKSSQLRCARVIDRHCSRDGTVKLVTSFDDGLAAEAVMMPADRDGRAAGCVSSQIGCAMGCDFCASTKNGLRRNLTAAEIVEQYLHLSAEAKYVGRRISSLVFMGMGEPMHNLDAVMDAIRRITQPGIGTIGKRFITVSTVGIVEGIDRLAASELYVHLALSLHAPDDATRARLVPMTRKHGVAEIVAAAKRYQEITGRIVTIEYCLLADVNDSDEQAESLALLLRGFRAHVNIIPYNVIGGVPYKRPAQERIDRFLAIVRQGAVAHLRRTRGDEVAAACGQLAGKARSLQVVS